MNKNYEGKLDVKIDDISDITYNTDTILIELKYKLDIQLYDMDDDEYMDDDIDSILLEKSDEGGYNVELQQSYTNKAGKTDKTAVDEFFIYT